MTLTAQHGNTLDNQYGFRPTHSNEHAALELIDSIINKMDTNEIPLNIFLDLSKAFDTIDHTIIFLKNEILWTERFDFKFIP